MKTRTIEFEGKAYTLIAKGQIRRNDGRCNVYGIRDGTKAYDDLIMPTGRSISDHLRRIGGPKPTAEQTAQPQGHIAASISQTELGDVKPASSPEPGNSETAHARASPRLRVDASDIGTRPERPNADRQPIQGRRGRPPKGETAMTGAERQRELQERRKKAEHARQQALAYAKRLRLWAEVNDISKETAPPERRTREFQEFKGRVVMAFGYLEHLLDIDSR
ncbi:MAG: hypothetical protein MEQ84_13300 [Mesorhizobium sp.]|nr:hypothetical protein [Mesorhizobium sp.]